MLFTLLCVVLWLHGVSGMNYGRLEVQSKVVNGMRPTISPHMPGDLSTLAQQCWETVVITSNSTLTLGDTDNPYRFKTLDFQS